MGVVRVEGARTSRSGREAGKAASPPATPGGARAFKVVGLVVVLLGFAMLAFVSGAYRPPLAFLAGAYQGISQQQRPELHAQHESRPPLLPPSRFHQNLISRLLSALYSLLLLPPQLAVLKASSRVRHERGRGKEDGAASSWRDGPRETRVFWVVRLVIVLVTFPTLAYVSGVYRPPLAFITRAYQGIPPQQRLPQRQQPVDDDAAFHGDVPRDKYLGGLLASTGFDENSCLSRYQSSMYRKPSPHKPSAYLVQKLRQYEERHKRCAPHTGAYNRTLQFLNDGNAPVSETECKYVVWAPWAGLGNRILTLASAFLYALLTDRVLLIDHAEDFPSLFCEPFPGTTWLLPSDFPITDFGVFGRKHPRSYGNLLKKNKISYNGADGWSPPSVVNIHLGDHYSTEDMHFFCEPDQAVLRRVPWLILESDLYFVPAFFLNQEFEPELSRMFPEKDTVFHHLSRYLFHPTNKVWGMITRYYRAYLAMAGERLGIQIRILSPKDAPFEVVSKQIINCTLKEKLLPAVDVNVSSSSDMAADPKKRKAVLLTSLYSEYLDKLQDMYWEHTVAGGAVVTVHQPTHEEWQQTGKASHDEKAWAEMNLLSFTDVLVTSSWSTFGYIAQGLGGIKPWILVRPEKAVMPEPTCVRDISMEPCLQKPTWYVCREKRNGDNARVVPFVTHCLDAGDGLKLVDRTS